jgi:transcriptional regulator with XRE-family HTH domain
MATTTVNEQMAVAKRRAIAEMRSARKARGLGQKELAYKVGASTSLIAKVEQETGTPSAETLIAIAEVLQIDPLPFCLAMDRIPRIVLELMAADPAKATRVLCSEWRDELYQRWLWPMNS